MTPLSRSKLELFLECPRCFWLYVKKGIKRPPMFPYTINNAVDYLLKQEFDAYRARKEAHPVMSSNGVDAVPFTHDDLNKWRHNFTGVRYEDPETEFSVFGAVDDVWIDSEGNLIVVDYKATGANEHRIHDSYKRQMEIYQWLLRRNEFPVSNAGYFLFAKVNKGNGFSLVRQNSSEGGGRLPFDLFLEKCEGDDTWIPEALRDAKKEYEAETPSRPSEECTYCEYRDKAGSMLK